MRPRTPIKIINGKVYCWVKMTDKEVQSLPEFYRRHRAIGEPFYCLGSTRLQRPRLKWPRPKGATTIGFNLYKPIEA